MQTLPEPDKFFFDSQTMSDSWDLVPAVNHSFLQEVYASFHWPDPAPDEGLGIVDRVNDNFVAEVYSSLR